MSATIYVERGDAEIEVSVTGTVPAYRPARINCYADESHPAEGGWPEDVQVVEPEELELTSEEMDRAEQALVDEAVALAEARIDDAIERRASREER